MAVRRSWLRSLLKSIISQIGNILKECFFLGVCSRKNTGLVKNADSGQQRFEKVSWEMSIGAATSACFEFFVFSLQALGEQKSVAEFIHEWLNIEIIEVFGA